MDKITRREFTGSALGAVMATFFENVNFLAPSASINSAA